jgi:hypothetical protein
MRAKNSGTKKSFACMAERKHVTAANFLRNQSEKVDRQTYAAKARPHPDFALENKGVWLGKFCMAKQTDPYATSPDS